MDYEADSEYISRMINKIIQQHGFSLLCRGVDFLCDTEEGFLLHWDSFFDIFIHSPS
jgi:hypothetical protein